MAFETSVFVNCPFDPGYRPVLSAILFVIVQARLEPRLATERADSGENRLTKIAALIQQSRFSIHDLCRCESAGKGEIARLNMPFELGLDYGVRLSGSPALQRKCFLVLDEKPYRLKQALSDINGWDTSAHEGIPERALKIVRNWLVQMAGVPLPGPEKLRGMMLIFDEWKYRQPDQSRQDVDDYEIYEVIWSMQEWVARGMPN